MTHEFLIPIALFAMIFGIVYVVVRRKERLTMIEKGADPSMFQKGSKAPATLKWGMLFVGIGVGILLGKIFAAYSCPRRRSIYVFHDLPVRRPEPCNFPLFGTGHGKEEYRSINFPE